MLASCVSVCGLVCVLYTACDFAVCEFSESDYLYPNSTITHHKSQKVLTCIIVSIVYCPFRCKRKTWLTSSNLSYISSSSSSFVLY